MFCSSFPQGDLQLGVGGYVGAQTLGDVVALLIAPYMVQCTHATQQRVQGVHGKEELIRYLAMGRWDGDGADARVTMPRAPNV